MNNPRILIAEDDAHIRAGLVDALESEGYAVEAVADGKAALDAFQKRRPDLVLLDIMMPEMSGYDVCRAIRHTDARTPVILLTAKGEEIDKVVGLELGADDYVTKPFGVRELLARVAAALRRSRAAAAPDAPAASPALPDPSAFGAATVDRKTYTVTCHGRSESLTARELKLIDFFAARPNEVIRREELLNRVWGITYYGTTRTLDQHIAQLRKKIESDPETPATILTVHGVGYRYVPAEPAAVRPGRLCSHVPPGKQPAGGHAARNGTTRGERRKGG
jgi:DNA-binding response OmpR family regulator